MDKIFEIITREEEYKSRVQSIDWTDCDQEIPVFVNESRVDLIKVIPNFTTENYKRVTVKTANKGFLLSSGLEFLRGNNELCKSWSDDFDISDISESVLIVGFYKDFIQDKLQKILERCKDEKINIYFILGRDLSSLTWMIAKQFVVLEGEVENGLFTYKNYSKDRVDSLEKQDNKLKVYDSCSLDEKNIKKELEEYLWNKLIFHGHGKEDNLNLSEYTICGLNSVIGNDENLFPSCGHGHQGCFKEDSKVIPLNKIKANIIYLLSCNNFPFFDSKLYGSKYNLGLNAIDGYSREIVASVGIQSTDNSEISKIIQSKHYSDIATVIHESLDDIQPFVSIVHIGVPVRERNTKSDLKRTRRLTKKTKQILTKVSLYSASLMLTKDNSIKKLSSKIISDYDIKIRRGIFGFEESEARKLENDLVNRVNPLSLKIANQLLSNQDDELTEFDIYNIYRSVVDKNSIQKKKCICGRDGILYTYHPELPTTFELDTQYCYRCGDKQVGMIGMPEVNFTCDERDEGSYEINYTGEIIPSETGEIFIGIQLPSYIEEYLDTPLKLLRIKNKSGQVVKIADKLVFKKDIPLQSYYMKLFIVQNTGIKISRSFFYLGKDEESRK
jgi:hypothetical protein